MEHFSYAKLSGASHQHCIGFSAVQCCSKSIKTTLHKILSYAMLSGASQIILHRVVTYAMFSQKY